MRELKLDNNKPRYFENFRNIVTGAAVSEAVIATSQATVVVESPQPQLAPEVSTASDVSTPVVTKTPPSAAKTKTEAESSKKVKSFS